MTRGPDTARLSLLAGLLLLTALSFEAARWTEGLWVLKWVVLGGVLAGYILARTPLSGLPSHLLGGFLGLGWSGLWALRLLDAPTWRLALEDLTYRVADWLQLAMSGGQGEDNLVFVLFLSLLLWHLAEAAAWSLFRLDNAWLPAAGACAVVAANAHYGDRIITLHLGLALLVGLALIILTHIRWRERRWQAESVRYDSEVGWHLLRQGMLWAAALAVGAFLSPVPGEPLDVARRLRAMEEPWARLQEEWSRVFNALNYRSPQQATSFGDRLLLAGPPRRGEEVVLLVRSAHSSYWRANVYHLYTGRGMVNTDEVRQSWAPADPRHRPPPYAARQGLTQTFVVQAVFDQVLFAAPQPITIHFPARAQFQPLPAEAGRGVTAGTLGREQEEAALAAEQLDLQRYPLVDASAFLPRRSLRSGDTYTVISQISVADKQSLRAAGEDYPDWVRERYLQLPDTVTARTRLLASRITTGHGNAYDRAEAIQSFLRQMQYQEEITGPPPGQDGVDYFLFDLRKGFCDYYATAMVVMLRAVGIPARVASGYAAGQLDEAENVWVVRDADGHSWVEVYFPAFGWIEFEPTPLRPLPGRAEQLAAADAPLQAAEPTPPPEQPGRDGQQDIPEDAGPLEALQERVAAGGGLLLGVAGLLAAAVLSALGVWWLETRPVGSAEAAYRRFLRLSGLLGVRRQDWQTPAHHARQVATRWPETRERAEELAELYGAERYGRREGLAGPAQAALAFLRRRLLKALLPRVRWGESPAGEERRERR